LKKKGREGEGGRSGSSSLCPLEGGKEKREREGERKGRKKNGEKS